MDVFEKLINKTMAESECSVWILRVVFARTEGDTLHPVGRMETFVGGETEKERDECLGVLIDSYTHDTSRGDTLVVKQGRMTFRRDDFADWDPSERSARSMVYRVLRQESDRIEFQTVLTRAYACEDGAQEL